MPDYLDQAEIPEGEKRQALQAAKRYFALAKSYTAKQMTAASQT